MSGLPTYQDFRVKSDEERNKFCAFAACSLLVFHWFKGLHRHDYAIEHIR
jgi:hypothetical protein